MSVLRRAEAANRDTTPVVARDLRGLVKVNPIATWTDEDVDGYIADHDVPVNPLTQQGYPSIGCMPCTTRSSTDGQLRPASVLRRVKLTVVEGPSRFRPECVLGMPALHPESSRPGEDNPAPGPTSDVDRGIAGLTEDAREPADPAYGAVDRLLGILLVAALAWEHHQFGRHGTRLERTARGRSRRRHRAFSLGRTIDAGGA